MHLLRLLAFAALGLLAPALASAQAIDPTFALPSGVYAPGSVYALGPQQADGKRLVSGYFTRVNNAATTSILLRLDTSGATDAAFAQNVGAASNIYRIKAFANGQYLLGAYGGSLTAGGLTRTEVLKLNADGTADASFDPGTGPDVAGGYAYGLDYTAQPDNKVLVAGYFSSYSGTAAGGIVRLNADGTVDASFNPGSGANITTTNNQCPGAATVQADGKILVGGSFTAFNGAPANGLVRLNANGTADTGFAVPFGASSYVTTIIAQPDGKLLVVGDLHLTGGGTANLVRLNANGALDTSFTSAVTYVYGGDFSDPGVVLQADGKLLAYGYLGATGTVQAVRLTATGSIDGSFSASAGINDVYTLGVQANGSVLLGGNVSYSTGTNQPLVRLSATGSLEAAFAPKIQTLGTLAAVARQPNGQLVLGGNVTEYNGVAVHQVLRVSATGVLDAAFAAASGTLPAAVTSLLVQPDGKIVVGTSSNVARLLASGAPDATFGSSGYLNTASLALQADGKLLVVGSFTVNTGSASARGLVRLTASGAYDPSFVQQTTTSVGTPYIMESVLVQADGKIVIGGRFTQGALPPAFRVVRYLPSGDLDPTFNNTNAFSAAGTSNPTPHVYALAQQPDGKLLAGGYFTQAGNSLAYGVARLTTTGDVDPTFAPNGTLSGTVYTLALQPNGRVLLGGSFATSSSTSALSNLTRVLSTGAFDPSFGPTANPNNSVRAALVQPDGGLVVAGYFSSLSGTAALRVARLTAPNVLAVSAPAALAARTAAWPVPAHSVLYVAPDLSAAPRALELTDALGRTLRRQTLSATAPEAAVNVEGLVPGVYVLRVQYTTGTATRAIVVE